MKKYFFLIVAIVILPFVSYAQEVTTFTSNIPFLTGEKTTQAFVSAIYQLAIALAAVIVVIRLIMAGAKYMLSEIVTSKSEAKEDIKNALFGLLIILGAVLILGTINPKLVGLDSLNGGQPVNINPSQPVETDNLNFERGTTRDKYEVTSRCAADTESGVDQSCVNESETNLRRSCQRHGGTFRDNAGGNQGWYSCE